MKADVMKHCKTCSNCQRSKRPYRRPPALIRPIIPPLEINNFISIDLTGPLNLTERRNRYIILTVDLLSKFIIAKAVPDGTADTVIQFFNDYIISIFGPPRICLSDNGA